MHLSNYFGCVSPVYYMLRPIDKSEDVRFYNYIFQSTVFQRSLYGLGNGILIKESGNGKLNTIRMRIPIDKFGGLFIPVAPIQEQKKIADFLDAKCAEIDALTADIQTQIDTLEQYKRSVITETVTKGMNPDAEMKDSGNQYWGSIPTNWPLSDIKYLFEIVKRIAGKEGYDILSVTQKGIKIKDISNNEGQVAESYANYQFVYPGDFVMRYEDENIWLTQKMMATLYDVDVRTINYHVKKIFSDSELQEAAVIRKFRITAADGKSYSTNHYSLEMIIAVGFKVNSERAVQFRKWVNQIAKNYTIKGWVMDDERLKRGTYLTEKYFDEQLERIREIRASERKFYQKITDLYATAIDYDKNSATTRRFYATVQNKMHYAVHGHTAAELIVERADHTKEHMGLTTWADAPEGKIKKSDVTVAKNYLSQNEMKQLNRMVTAYLDFAENMTLRHIPLTMQDWEKRLNSFIEMFDYGILQDAGKVTAEIAKLHAETEFEKYRVIQDRLFMSDFDKYMLELEENAKN